MKKLRNLVKLEAPKEIEHPSSKELFAFVRDVVIRVLEIEDPERLRDGDVGKLAGYGSDETSRWKHGTRKFDSLERIMFLHENLDIDEYLLLRVATGRMKAREALKIWELGFRLRDTYRKERLENYLRSQKIDFKLVIIHSEEREKETSEE